MPHESRLTLELRALLNSQRVAALATVNDDASPFVSMVPFAIEPLLAYLVLHVSGLAAHTGNLQARSAVSVLVMRPEVLGEPVHALARVTLEGQAKVLEPESLAWRACRTAYLERFPEAGFMTELADFRFVAIEVKGARQVAGFGAARSMDAGEIKQALAPAS